MARWKRKDLSKDQILMAMKSTRSNRAAARHLHCSYIHYKKWAKIYDSDELRDPNDPSKGYKSLFEKHLNPSGKGIPKFLGGMDVEKFPILDIIEGRLSCDHFEPKVIKDAMIKHGYLAEECCNCGFNERRVTDYKMPLLLHFKDGKKFNYSPDNCVLYCYNCYFLHITDIFTPKQELGIQDHKPVMRNEGKVDWELDEYQKEALEKIILDRNQVPNPEDEDDYGGIISKK